MPKLVDLSGTILGRLTVISYQGKGNYLCYCSCGNKNHVTRAKYIQQKRVKSCGCIKQEKTIKIGEKYGKLTVAKKMEKGLFLFSCDCGNQNFIRNGNDVKYGKIQSCGCLYHNMTGTTEFISWTCMKSRCYTVHDKEYKNYGGRGIIVCDEWRNDFRAFLQDMGLKPTKKHTLDRIDVNKNYCKENCRWATQKEQMNNTRHNRLINYNNTIYTTAQFSELTGIPAYSVRRKLNIGWSANNIIKHFLGDINV